jgi:hypothetical protein
MQLRAHIGAHIAANGCMIMMFMFDTSDPPTFGYDILSMNQMAARSVAPGSRVTIVLVAVSLLSILTVGGVAWREATNSLLTSSFESLKAVETSKAREIENYFEDLDGHVQQLAGDPTIVEATVRLSRGFDQVVLEPVPTDVDSSVERYYEEQFLPRLSENATGSPDYGVFEPNSQAAKVLQYRYISENANAVGVKQFLDDAGDGSEYSRWHAHYHPGIRSLLEKFSYYDIFFVDIESGDIVYTVAKESDYGTNLLNGPYRNSGLAEVVGQVMADPVRQTVKIVDFAPYAPSYNAPASFIAAPVFNGDHPVGILAIQIPIDEINAVMTSEQQWADEGMGASGETFIIGPDRLMRSDSRLLIENREAYFEEARSAGVAPDIVARIDTLNSTILMRRIDSPSAMDAIAGDSGSALVVDHRGSEVLSAYSPLDIRGLDWAILSEIDRAEALAPVDQLLRRVLIAAAIFVPLIALASIWIARRHLAPVHKVINLIQSTMNNTDAAADTDTPELAVVDLDAPGVFGQLGESIHSLVEQVDVEKQRLETGHQQLMLRRTASMPQSVAERVVRGEEDAVDEGSRCYATVIQLAGGPVAPDTELGDSLAAIARFNAELADLARGHCIDLFVTVGFEYVGVVGLAANYLDSAERALVFAKAACGLAADVDGADALGIRVAIDVGPMRGVMDASSPYGYTIQGEVIARAKLIAGRTPERSIMVSNDTQERLGEQLADATPQTISIGHRSTDLWQLQYVASDRTPSLSHDSADAAV